MDSDVVDRSPAERRTLTRAFAVHARSSEVLERLLRRRGDGADTAEHVVLQLADNDGIGLLDRADGYIASAQGAR